MKVIKQLLPLILLAGVLCATASAQQGTYVGTSAGNFLKIGLGAKAAGMGESYVTMSEDASSLFWNPGATTRIGRPSVIFSNIQWLVETNISYVAATVPFSFGTAGLDVAYFGSGNILETTLERQDGTGRVVTASDMAIGLGFARDFTDRLAVGVKIKYIREELAAVSADAFAFDIGSVFTTSFLNDLKLGIAFSNFGTGLRFDGRELLVSHVVPGSPTGKQVPAELQTESWPLPHFFRFGVSTDVVKTEGLNVHAAYTITDSRDYGDRHNVGVAVTVEDIVTVRGGYRFNYDETTFSAGAGFGFNLENIGKITIDYAYTNFGKLKAVHQWTLGMLLP